MRNTGVVVTFGVIVLGALLFGFWSGNWTKRDVKKVADAAQEKIAEVKHSAEAAVQAVTG
ncbi:MAG: hypothetical protein ACYC4L_08885 [Chloroflexota bacterium]